MTPQPEHLAIRLQRNFAIPWMPTPVALTLLLLVLCEMHKTVVKLSISF
jgi:hypothetical protein